MEHRYLLTLAAFLLLQLPVLEAQPVETSPSKPERPQRERGDQEVRWRQILQNASPEEREKLKKNRAKWEELSPGEKAELRTRGKEFHQQVRSQIQEAIQRSGLNLEGENRRRYAEAYLQGRRKIEGELREQMKELRKEKIEELETRLKSEFSN